MRRLLALALVGLLARPTHAGYKATIVRDKFGVPHVFGKSDGDVAFGLLAVFVVLATLANFRTAGIPLVGKNPDDA